MKKLIFILLSICLVGMLFPSVAFAEEETKDWAVYFEEEIVPYIIKFVTILCGLYIAILPILTKMKNASLDFNQATGTVQSAKKEAADNKKLTEMVVDKLEGFSKCIGILAERLEKVENKTENTEQMIKLGFCNMDELVVKGYAREVAKVGKNEETEVEN